MTTISRSRSRSANARFIPPPETTTPKQRRQFAMLIAMASVILLLLWIFFAPWMYRRDERAINGFLIFQRIGNIFGKTFSAATNSSPQNP